jgi:hypothetical protein
MQRQTKGPIAENPITDNNLACVSRGQQDMPLITGRDDIDIRVHTIEIRVVR